MKEIQEINLARMSNGAHHIFVREIVMRAQSDAAVSSKLGQLVNNLATAVEAEDESIKLSQKSFLSDTIAQADRARDGLYSSYKKAVEAFLGIPVEDMAEAAKVLNQHLKDYAIDTKSELHKESGLLLNLVTDLEGKFAPQVATLSLTSLVASIKDANERVMEADRDRTTERLGAQVGALKAARAASDNAYRALVRMVNALVLVSTLETPDGDPSYTPFIDFVNQQVVQYKRTVLKQTATAPGTSKPSTGGDTPDTPETPETSDTPETPENPGGSGGSDTPGTGSGGGGEDDFV